MLSLTRLLVPLLVEYYAITSAISTTPNVTLACQACSRALGPNDYLDPSRAGYINETQYNWYVEHSLTRHFK